MDCMKPGYRPKPRVAANPDPVLYIQRAIRKLDSGRARAMAGGMRSDGDLSLRLLDIRTTLCAAMRMCGATDDEMETVT